MSPKGFSEGARSEIRQRLLGVAADHFTRYGYRKANIAEVAREVGIGKGTLYLFVASKAELFLQVVLEVETGMRARLLEEMRKPYPTARDRLRRFLHLQCEALAEHPILAVMTNPEDAATLMRDLPEERMEELRVSDETFYTELVEGWQRKGQVAMIAPGVIGALPRALFAVTLHREMVAGENFAEVINLIIEGLSSTLSPGSTGGATS